MEGRRKKSNIQQEKEDSLCVTPIKELLRSLTLVVSGAYYILF